MPGLLVEMDALVRYEAGQQYWRADLTIRIRCHRRRRTRRSTPLRKSAKSVSETTMAPGWLAEGGWLVDGEGDSDVIVVSPLFFLRAEKTAYFLGTFLPFLRALDRPMAMACARLARAACPRAVVKACLLASSEPAPVRLLASAAPAG